MGRPTPTLMAIGRPVLFATAMSFEPLPRLSFPNATALFSTGKRTVYETFFYIDFSSIV